MTHHDSPIARLLQDPYDIILSNSILGSADPEAIHRAADDFSVERMGSPVDEVTFCILSVGAASGVRLEDGRHALIKAWNAAADAAALDSIHTVQHALAEEGFPAPRVFVRPARFMIGRASVMEWMDRGEQQDARDPALRRAMAASLARMVALAEPFVHLPGLPRHGYPHGRAWDGPADEVRRSLEMTVRSVARRVFYSERRTHGSRHARRCPVRRPKNL